MKGSLKYLSGPRLFDPEEGTVVIEPTGNGKGYWVGAVSALFDPDVEKYYLYYRVREPRPVRGGKCVVAESEDGISFRTIWQTTKEDLQSDSIERSSLFKTTDGWWRLYISYVDPADQRWRVDVIEAAAPDQFDIAARKKVLVAADINAEGVKDPYVFNVDGKFYMLLSYAPGQSGVTEDVRRQMHASSDIYNTGLTKSSSGLAVSDDGLNWDWQGDIFAPSESGWDKHAARLGSVRRLPELYVGFYDGGPSHTENYEEQMGLAVSQDLKDWHRVSVSGPALKSPHSSGSLRYLDPLVVGTEVLYYYEYARADGAHEIRMNRVSF